MDEKDLKKIGKYFWINLLIPLIVPICLSVILFHYDEYDSIEEKHYIQFGYFLGIFFQLFIGLLGVTIFLNKKAFIRHNFLFSLLTWFLVPLLVILWIIGSLLIGNSPLDRIVLIMIYSIVAYIVVLIITFIIFRNKLK